MKKKFFLIGALVAMSMSAMFVACEGSKPANGCICTVTDKDGEKETNRITFEDMVDHYGATTCSELNTKLKDYIPASASVACKGY